MTRLRYRLAQAAPLIFLAVLFLGGLLAWLIGLAVIEHWVHTSVSGWKIAAWALGFIWGALGAGILALLLRLLRRRDGDR